MQPLKHGIKYCEKVYERPGKTLLCSFINTGKILDKVKARDFNATSLSTYDFSTVYTTVPPMEAIADMYVPWSESN